MAAEIAHGLRTAAKNESGEARMNGGLMFWEVFEGEWQFAFDGGETLDDTYEDMVDDLDRGGMSASTAIKRLGPLINANPEWLAGIVMRGGLLEEIGLDDEAEADYRRAYRVGLAKLPKGHKGKIEWISSGNRPFLRSAGCLAELMIRLKRYGEATPIMRKMLKWSPNDNPIRFDLGPALLRQGRTEAAKRAMTNVLKSDESVDVGTLFELALAHIEGAEWFDAGVRLREAWIANPYVPELLACGPGNRPKGYCMESDLGDYDGAAAYSRRWGERWRMNGEALDFLWWLYNTPSVLRERAAALHAAERLMWETDFDARGRIIRAGEHPWRIGRDAFRDMIAVRKTDRDGTDRPWRLLRNRRAHDERIRRAAAG